ncbi:MAG: DUF2076 family protein, partial [Comamonas sp.]
MAVQLRRLVTPCYEVLNTVHIAALAHSHTRPYLRGRNRQEAKENHMTSQEQQLLRELFERLAQTRGAPKDAQAEAEIRQGLAAVPDAAYWLAQRSLLL